MNDREIEQEEDTSTLFRSSTMATCLMDQYMKVYDENVFTIIPIVAHTPAAS